MRSALLLRSAVITILVFTPGTGRVGDATAEGETGASSGMGLPASLESLYPPSSPAPVFLLGKIEMADALSAILADMLEGDGANLAGDFDDFRARYAKIRDLVPEWRDRFPDGPVDQLGAALTAGEPERIQKAFEVVGDVCTACHETDLAAVQQRFHWKRFDAVTVRDPVNGEDTPLAPFMIMLSANLAGISRDVDQGQIDNARQHCRTLSIRMEALAQTCMECHETERRYYVDDDVLDMIRKLDGTLAAAVPDPEGIRRLSGAIGMESCFKCHMVHMPAALAQNRRNRADPAAR